MFETAVLSYGPASKRVWATFMGMTGQVLLVGTAVLVPLMFPSALPKPQALLTWLEAPAPPPPPPAAVVTAAVARPALRPFQVQEGKLYEPGKVPERVAAIVEEMPAAAPGIGVPGGIGDPNGVPGGTGVVGSILDQAARMAYVPPVVQRVAPAAPVAAPIQRVRSGGVVKEAVPIRRIEPTYPDLARRMRISGIVKLEGVIAIDGRISELRVLSGHPLLVAAAVEAVRQWLYQPTRLNGDPVEVVAPIDVIFRMN